MKKDIEATEARRFLDARSYVTPDRREILYGEDWSNRKHELWLRGEGRCEYIVTTSLGFSRGRCEQEMQDPHHVIRRSERRDDSLSNLIGLCRFHHDQQDRRKTRFGEGA